MSDLPVYVMANLIVDDKEKYREYEKGFFPILKRYNGEFITFDDKHETLEGEASREGRMILFRFPSEEQAKAWYNDEEYQALSEHRRASTRLQFLTMVHSLPARA